MNRTSIHPTRLTIALLASVTMLAMAAPSALAAPTYASKWGTAWVGNCKVTVQGGSQYGRFIATASGNTYCGSTNVEVEYRDMSGRQQVMRAQKPRNVSTGEPPSASIILNSGTYSSVQGVIGSGTDWYWNNTPGVYLYW